MPKVSKKAKPPKKSQDIPVTQAMLFELREELINKFNSNENSIKANESSIKSNEAAIKANEIAIKANEAALKALEKKMEARFEQVDARFEQVDARFDQVDRRFDQMEKKFEAKFDKLIGEVHRIALLVEDQNARNKYVLDGYTSLSDRLDKVEAKVFKDDL